MRNEADCHNILSAASNISHNNGADLEAHYKV
jgi:hypothetical protein